MYGLSQFTVPSRDHPRTARDAGNAGTMGLGALSELGSAHAITAVPSSLQIDRFYRRSLWPICRNLTQGEQKNHRK